MASNVRSNYFATLVEVVDSAAVVEEKQAKEMIDFILVSDDLPKLEPRSLGWFGSISLLS